MVFKSLIGFVAINVLLISPVVLSAETANKVERLLTLSDNEFTELFIQSLAEDNNGAVLLSVSESINTQIFPDYIEFTGIVDLDKVAQIDDQARQTIEQLDSFLFFLDHNHLNLTVIAEPVVRSGLVGVKDNFSIKLGPLPLSNDTLRQLGIPVENANVTNLKLKDLQVQKMTLSQGRVTMSLASK